MHEAEFWKIATAIEKDGLWHLAYVDDGATPRRGYTTGLWANFRHPEICVVGPSEETALSLLDVIAEAVRAGEGGFQPRTRYGQFLEGADVEFVRVEEALYEDAFPTAVWYYCHHLQPAQGFPMLQCVLPYGGNGAFPWDPDWPAHLDQWQPVLGLRL
ncbi:MAG: DUF4262 domain-containing protein [Alphaproteobacteria bacterium]|nr:DUF4262 domain-containing protein [Alphaproteobacteria bacterium]